jgi:DNA-binding CsgD family transcriptional regulator
MMPNVLDFLTELLPHRRVREGSLPAGQEDLYWAVAALLSPGNCYFFIFEVQDAMLRYVHPAVQDVLGCAPADFSPAYLAEIMHPEDAPAYALRERAALDFFQARPSASERRIGKTAFTFRVRDGAGGWRHLLQQSLPIGLDAGGRVQTLLGVHTDITYLGLPADGRVFCFGQPGDPPRVAAPGVPPGDLPADISGRERAIVLLLAEGLSSKQIAERLGISKSTVDTHRRNLLRKTGAKNTLELAVRMTRPPDFTHK